MSALLAALALMLLLTLALVFAPSIRERGVRQAIVPAMIAGLIACLLYAFLGGSVVIPMMKRLGEQQALAAQEVSQAEGKLREAPKDPASWVLHGQALERSGDYAGAANSYREAVLLSKGHPRVVMAYAEALTLAAGGTVTPKAKQSIDIALMLDPGMPIARYYNAVWMLQNDQAPQAMQEMKKLYRELPDDSPLKQKMNEQIGR